jgi:hypothetical protein
LIELEKLALPLSHTSAAIAVKRAASYNQKAKLALPSDFF